MIDILFAHKNHSDYLEYQLLSLEAVKSSINKVIVVDDFSDDSHIKKLIVLSEKYGFYLYKNRIKPGMHNTYNLALQYSDAEYVYFASCDDLINSNFITDGLNALTLNKKNNILVAEIIEQHYINGSMVNEIEHKFLSDNLIYISPSFYMDLHKNGKKYFSGGATIYKRKYICEIGGYIVNLGLYADIYPQILGALKSGLLYLPLHASKVKIKNDSYNVNRANDWNKRRIDGLNFIKRISKHDDLEEKLIQIKIGNITSCFLSSILYNIRLFRYFNFNFKFIIIEILSFFKINGK